METAVGTLMGQSKLGSALNSRTAMGGSVAD
jgi:hypothetical protein